MTRKRLTSMLGAAGSGFATGFSQGTQMGLGKMEMKSRDSRQKAQLKIDSNTLALNIGKFLNSRNKENAIKNIRENQQDFENWLVIGSNDKMPIPLRKEAWKKLGKHIGSDVTMEMTKTPKEKLPDFFKGLDALISLDQVKEDGRISLTRLKPHLSRFLNAWQQAGMPDDISQIADEFIDDRRNEEPAPVRKIEISNTSDGKITKQFSGQRLTSIKTEPKKQAAIKNKISNSKRKPDQIGKDIRNVLDKLARKTGRFSQDYLDKLTESGKINPYLKGLMNSLENLKIEYSEAAGKQWDTGK